MNKIITVPFVLLTSVFMNIYTTGYRHVVLLFDHHVTRCLLKFHQTFPPINSCNIVKLDG